MSALRLINETTFSGVSTVNVTDVFSADFDIYKITYDDGGQYGLLRFISSGGSVVKSAHYTTARQNLWINTTFTETRSNNDTNGVYCFTESSSADGGGNELWIFNPFNASAFTFVIAETVDIYTSTNHRIAKTVGVYENTGSMSGFQLNALLNTDGTLRTYGLAVN